MVYINHLSIMGEVYIEVISTGEKVWILWFVTCLGLYVGLNIWLKSCKPGDKEE